MEVEEEEIEILEHDLKRSMVNHEFMILYGNDPSGVCVAINHVNVSVADPGFPVGGGAWTS